MSEHLGMIISEVRYISGINKMMQAYANSIDPAKMEAINATIISQVRKSVLSTALRYKNLTSGVTNCFFGKDDAKTILDLFNHAAKIPLHEQSKLENTCKGISAIIGSLSVIPKTKKIAKVKGDDKDSTDEAEI